MWKKTKKNKELQKVIIKNWISIFRPFELMFWWLRQPRNVYKMLAIRDGFFFFLSPFVYYVNEKQTQNGNSNNNGLHLLWLLESGKKHILLFYFYFFFYWHYFTLFSQPLPLFRFRLLFVSNPLEAQGTHKKTEFYQIKPLGICKIKKTHTKKPMAFGDMEKMMWWKENKTTKVKCERTKNKEKNWLKANCNYSVISDKIREMLLFFFLFSFLFSFWYGTLYRLSALKSLKWIVIRRFLVVLNVFFSSFFFFKNCLFMICTRDILLCNQCS